MPAKRSSDLMFEWPVGSGFAMLEGAGVGYGGEKIACVEVLELETFISNQGL